jgi:hypothetical protein
VYNQIEALRRSEKEALSELRIEDATTIGVEVIEARKQFEQSSRRHIQCSESLGQLKSDLKDWSNGQQRLGIE